VPLSVCAWLSCGAGSGLPALPFAELEPAVGDAGDVIAFCTNVLHCASRNVDTRARKIMFINFCAADALDTTAGNHDLTQVCEHYDSIISSINHWFYQQLFVCTGLLAVLSN
jgi:hypothetical protein